MLKGVWQSVKLVLKTSTNLPCFIWLLIRAPLSQTFPQNPKLELPVALGSKGRCSALRSSLKGHVLPDAGEHAAHTWPVFVALELNVHPAQRDIWACAFGDGDFKASTGAAAWGHCGAASEESLSSGLALQKFSYSLRVCVPLIYKGLFFPCWESQNFPAPVFSSIQEYHNMSPKTINYLVKAEFLFLPENFPCQELEGET